MPPRLSFLADGLSALIALLLVVCSISFAAAQAPTPMQIADAVDVQLPEDPATVVAVIGNDRVLYGDVSPKVEARIAEVMGKTEQEIPAEQLHYARVNLTRSLLGQTIRNKMMRASFLLDQVGTQSADKRREAEETMTVKARQMFYEAEIPELYEQYEVTSLRDLDEQLREKNSSLAARERDFIDMMLGHLYIRGKVEKDPKVSIAEIVGYYQTHLAEYEHPARSKWEQLSVLFENFPSRQAAYEAIEAMGREAYFGGSMQAVARAKSQEPYASSGGVHDWISKGSLASEILDEKVFSLPIGKMSEIIEDGEGFHIVRVLDRQAAGVTPLSDLQDEIRTKIRQQKINTSQQSVMEEMQARVPVWTMFPDDVPGSMPLPRIANRAQSSSMQR